MHKRIAVTLLFIYSHLFCLSSSVSSLLPLLINAMRLLDRTVGQFAYQLLSAGRHEVIALPDSLSLIVGFQVDLQLFPHLLLGV